MSKSTASSPVVTSISSRRVTRRVLYYEGDRRGYFKATVTPKQMRLDLRFVTSVENPGGEGYAEASWVVKSGVPGAELA